MHKPCEDHGQKAYLWADFDVRSRNGKLMNRRENLVLNIFWFDLQGRSYDVSQLSKKLKNLNFFFYLSINFRRIDLPLLDKIERSGKGCLIEDSLKLSGKI